LWQQWSQQGLNAMGKLVADIIVETLQNAGVKSRRSGWRFIRLAPFCTAVAGTSGKWRRRISSSRGAVFPVRDGRCGAPDRFACNMSVVKHRCHGLTAIAQLAGAIGRAHSQIF
jgi:hypothetical protein